MLLKLSLKVLEQQMAKHICNHLCLMCVLDQLLLILSSEIKNGLRAQYQKQNHKKTTTKLRNWN